MDHNLKFEKKLLIVGFGNQAKAWAKNLRDRNWDITIFLRLSSSHRELVKKDQFLLAGKDDLRSFRHMALLIPDDQISSFLASNHSYISPKAKLIYAHGVSLLENSLDNKFPDFSHLLLAPKSIASELRNRFLSEKGVGGLYSTEYSLEEEIDKLWLFELAKDLGIKSGPFASTFKEETQADLFSEQSLLCGLLPFAANSAFKFMLQKGISKEAAFLETWHELKLIVDAMVESGPENFFSMISPNALLGSMKGKKIWDELKIEDRWDDLWSEIQSGQLTEEIKNLDYHRLEMKKFWSKSELNSTANQLLPSLES